MRRWTRRRLSSSYTLYREYRLLRLSLEAWSRSDREPILVYQMGKVGSTAVTRALQAACPRRAVYHLHSLSPERLENEERQYRKHFRDRRRIDGHLLHSLFVRRRLRGWPPRPRRWKVVTLVRDPVERNASTFFQTLDLHFAGLGFAGRIRSGDGTVVSDLLAYFVESFPHERVLTWFDDEIRAQFGVDVLAEPFPHHQGYRLYRAPRADVLLVRLGDLGHAAEKAFRELLGVEGVEVTKTKAGARAYYAGSYRRFLDRLYLEEPLLDRIYGSRLVRTLYSAQEIAAFRARWTAP